MTGDRYYQALRLFHRTQRPGDTLVRPSAAPVSVLPTPLTRQFTEARHQAYMQGRRDEYKRAWRWGVLCGATVACVLSLAALGAALDAGLLQWVR